MSVTQIIQSVIQTADGGGPPPPLGGNNTFGFYVNPSNWNVFGGNVVTNPGVGQSTAIEDSVYTFPDNSAGSVLNFNGSQAYASPNLGNNGAWQNATAIAINLWFYPTQYGVQIMSEADRQDAVSGYHYTMLEIDTTGHVLARWWAGPTITSDNTITLNAWNHVYFATDWNGGKYFYVNDVTTNSQNYTTRTGPGINNEFFLIGYSDVTNMGNSNSYVGKIASIEISDYPAGSNFNTYRSKFGL